MRDIKRRASSFLANVSIRRKDKPALSRYLSAWLYEEEASDRDTFPVAFQVTCQDEESSHCIPKKTFAALLRLPEVSSNLAAYSRTARIIQETKDRDDMVHLKALSSEESDDAEICIPSGVYLELFRDPALRGHLSVMARTHKLPEFPGRPLDDSEEIESRDLIPELEKRSLATLAKNDDLPITIQERQGGDDDEKRSPHSGYVFVEMCGVTLENLLRFFLPFSSYLLIKLFHNLN